MTLLIYAYVLFLALAAVSWWMSVKGQKLCRLALAEIKIGELLMKDRAEFWQMRLEFGDAAALEWMDAQEPALSAAVTELQTEASELIDAL